MDDKNCDRNLWPAVDEDDNGKLGLERLNQIQFVIQFRRIFIIRIILCLLKRNLLDFQLDFQLELRNFSLS